MTEIKDTNIDECGDAFERCLGLLKDKTKNTDINASTIIRVVRIAMEIVESTQLKGNAQKKLVNKLVRQIVVDAPISDKKEALLIDMIDEGIVGDVIDLVVSATKGELDVNALEKAAVGCCLSVLKSRKSKTNNKI